MFESLEMLDRSLFLKINGLHSPLMDVVMWQLSESWHTYVLIAACLYAFFKWEGRKKTLEIALGIALAFACTDFSSNLIKHGVQRYRPSHNLELQHAVHLVNDYRGGMFGFFSAHAANTMAITGFVFCCLATIRPRWRYALFVYPVLVAYSRIYLGVHYPADCLVGLAYGFLLGVLIYLIMNRFFFRTHA